MDTPSSKPAQHGREISQDALRDGARANPRRERETLLGRIGWLWINFLRGQLTLMLVVGVVTWLGLAALGMRGALWLGVTAGLLEGVPRLGPVIATVPAVLFALRYGSSYLSIRNELLAVLVALFYVLVQAVENVLLVPRVMGDALKLPALVVLAGVVVGGLVAGIPGALLATPLIATGRELWRYYRAKKTSQVSKDL